MFKQKLKKKIKKIKKRILSTLNTTRCFYLKIHNLSRQTWKYESQTDNWIPHQSPKVLAGPSSSYPSSSQQKDIQGTNEKKSVDLEGQKKRQ